MFGQCKDMTLKFVNNTGNTITVPAEGHRVKNRKGSLEGWNDMQLGESINDLAPGAEHSTRQTLTIVCSERAAVEVHYTSTAGGEYTQLFNDVDIADKHAVLTLTNN